MTGLYSLALFALQTTAGLPPGTEVDALHRFETQGNYQPKAQTLAVDGDFTYVISSATSFGMRSWTRSKLDSGGTVIWSHTDYQTTFGGSTVFVADLRSDAHVAPGAGLLISAQVDGREDGVYRVLAHRVSDGSEAWGFEPDLGINGLEIGSNAQSTLIVDEASGVVLQVLDLSGEVLVRRIDLLTGSLLSSSGYLSGFDGSSLYDVELSGDGARLYLVGSVTETEFFQSTTQGVALAIDMSNGAELWKTFEPERLVTEVDEQPGTSQLALSSNVYFAGTRLWTVDGVTGAETWSQITPAPASAPVEMSYTSDGTGIIVTGGPSSLAMPFAPWEPGGLLERFDSTDGSPVWQRSVSPQSITSTFAIEPLQLALHPDGTALWSYLSSYDANLDPVATVTLETIDLATGTVLFDETVQGRTYERMQAVPGTAEFALIQTDPVQPGSNTPRKPTVRRNTALTGGGTLAHEPDQTGPVRSFAVNFEVTDDATRAAMMRYVYDVDPRLELVWIDLGTGQELWSDVLPATAGLNIADGFDDRNREMLLSPDESVLVSIVRGDGGQSYKLRVRAYEVATGQLLWSDSYDKQKGASLFNSGLTRPGNRSIEVTDGEVILAGNISQVEGMLLASRDLWSGVENWRIDSESGTSNYAYSTHVALDGDDVYAFLEAPLGALSTPGRRVVRVDRATGAILGFREIITNGFLTRLFAKGAGEPLLVCDNTVTGNSVINTRLLSTDLSNELALFSAEYGGEPLATGEGYLVAGEFQAGDTAAPGEVDVDVSLLSELEAAPGGAPSSLGLLDRGQLAFDVIDANPLSGSSTPFVRFWDATDGSFMWAGPLFNGTGWDIGDLAHLEQLPGRAGFVASEGSMEVTIPAPGTKALAPVVQVLNLPELIIEPTEVSLSGGTQLDYWLRRNADANGPQAYLLLGGLAEVSNGPVLDGIQMPFAANDEYTLLTLTQANQGVFIDTLGLLDDDGNARARIDSPAGLDPILVGAIFNYAWLTIDLSPFTLIANVSHTAQTLKLP